MSAKAPDPQSMDQHIRWMDSALALAERGIGRTWPNPSVGCVIVKEGAVVGRGWTQPGGRPHAEAMALEQAGTCASGADIYVTLEPCAHNSPRGACCTDIVLAARPRRVIVAAVDPDPRTAGDGIERLKAAGITVILGVGAETALKQQAGFRTRLALGRPMVTLKIAASLDGRIALPSGESQWISGEVARQHSHMERARHDAILIGRGTLEMDDPALDVRLPGLEERSPLPIVASRQLQGIPTHLKLASRARLASHEDMASLVSDLGKEGVTSVLVEGGQAIATTLLTNDLVDRLLWYSAPILIGQGRSAILGFELAELSKAHGRWRRLEDRALGEDRLAILERIR